MCHVLWATVRLIHGWGQRSHAALRTQAPRTALQIRPEVLDILDTD